MLKLLVEVLQLQMWKRMMHLSCRFLSFMEGKDLQKFSKVIRKQRNGTRLCVEYICVLFSSLFLPQLCDHIVFITRSSSWVSQDHEIPIWTAFQLWISYGKILPPRLAVFSWGPRSHLKSRHSNEKMRKKSCECMDYAVVVESVFCCCGFLGKNCKAWDVLSCFMVMDFFAISISLCVFASQDWFLSTQSSVDRHRATHKSSVGRSVSITQTIEFVTILSCMLKQWPSWSEAGTD